MAVSLPYFSSAMVVLELLWKTSGNRTSRWDIYLAFSLWDNFSVLAWWGVACSSGRSGSTTPTINLISRSKAIANSVINQINTVFPVKFSKQVRAVMIDGPLT